MTIRSDRKSADDTPWAVDARHAMQATTGDQLKVRYEVPRELPPELNALRFRMDERGENKQQRRGIASWCRPSSAGILPMRFPIGNIAWSFCSFRRSATFRVPTHSSHGRGVVPRRTPHSPTTSWPKAPTRTPALLFILIGLPSASPCAAAGGSFRIAYTQAEG